MSGRFVFLKTSPQRIRLVVEDIHAGSDPRIGFYALLVTSSLIAGLGLIANSTAVIIGAMLVSPLMTPIFGMALGMLRGDTKLFWRASTAECMGVVLAVGVPALFALLPVSIEETPEMLSRTSPNLLDLLVAVLAGFAGSYALVDERLSPALPGVAIATAIVPPLANTGICLAINEQEAAFGSFSLFLANFVSILLVGLLTFATAGMMEKYGGKAPSGVLRRFALPVTAFVITTVLMTHSLILSVEKRELNRTIRDEVRRAFEPFPSVAVDEIEHDLVERGKRLDVLVTVRSPKPLSPTAVSGLQNSFSKSLGTKTDLIVRTLLAKDVAAVGSNAQVAQDRLGGRLIEEVQGADEKTERLAEQVLLEALAREPGIELVSIDFGRTRRPFVVATLKSFRRLMSEEIKTLRRHLRERLKLPTLDLLVEVLRSTLQTSDENFLMEWTDYSRMSAEDELAAAEVRRIVQEEINKLPELFCSAVHINAGQGDKNWRILAEVFGSSRPTAETVKAFGEAVSQRSPRPVECNVWFRTDVIVTATGYNSFRNFTRESFEKRVETLPQIFGTVKDS